MIYYPVFRKNRYYRHSVKKDQEIELLITFVRTYLG